MLNNRINHQYKTYNLIACYSAKYKIIKWIEDL